VTVADSCLDPEIAALIALLPQRDYATMTPELSRAGMLAVAAAAGPATDGPRGTDLVVGDIGVRRYDGSSGATVVYLHGGGWVSGDLQTHDAQCARLVAATGATVLAVGYRRAPEAPFPAGLDDALAVLRSARLHADVDPDRLAVAGDSAGANLAAAACLVLRDEGIALRAQLLLYPATDLRRRYADDGGYPSRAQNASGYLLGMPAMRWFCEQYVGAADAEDPRASVITALDLSGLAPAVVATAQFDPLRDEGLAFAARLDVAGVPVSTFHGSGLVHGYCGAVGYSAAARTETDRVLAAFAKLLS
jgi:acetyl esterase